LLTVLAKERHINKQDTIPKLEKITGKQ